MGAPHEVPPSLPLTRMTWQDAIVVVAGLAFTAFLVTCGISLETAIVVTLTTVAALVTLVLSPKEILELVRLVRDIKRLGAGGMS